MDRESNMAPPPKISTSQMIDHILNQEKLAMNKQDRTTSIINGIVSLSIFVLIFMFCFAIVYGVYMLNTNDYSRDVDNREIERVAEWVQRHHEILPLVNDCMKDGRISFDEFRRIQERCTELDYLRTFEHLKNFVELQGAKAAEAEPVKPVVVPDSVWTPIKP